MSEPSGLLKTLQGHVDEIRILLNCGVCVKPLYEPFTLACGHTFCYTCLTQWFTSHRRKKTCPECRAKVLHQPGPAYLIRSLVHEFVTRPELLEKGETTAEHLESKRAEGDKLEADRQNQDPTTGGLFQGCFRTSLAGQPVHDTEDGVDRCPRCTWELEEGECRNCGYSASYHSGESDYSYSDESLATADDGADEQSVIHPSVDNFEDDIHPADWQGLIEAHSGPFEPHVWHSYHNEITFRSEENSSEDDDDYDYEMSFIDDDEEEEEGEEEQEVTDVGTDSFVSPAGDSAMSDAQTDNENEGDAGNAFNVSTGRRRTVIESDSDRDDDDDTDALNTNTNGQRRAIELDSDGDDDHTNDDNDDDDDDDDDDDPPVRPLVSQRLRVSLASPIPISSSPVQSRSSSHLPHGAEGTESNSPMTVDDDSDVPIRPTRNQSRWLGHRLNRY